VCSSDLLPAGPVKLRRDELARVVRFGLPSGVNWFLEFAAFALFINVVVGHLGTTVLAAFNVVFQINSISFMPAFGVASAGAIMVGENIGKRSLDGVWPVVRMTLIVTTAWMTTVGVLYFVAPGPLMLLFRPDDVPAETLVTTGALMLRLCAAWQVFDAIGITLGEALRAAGDTSWPMKVRIAMAWLGFTPATWAAVYLLDGGVITIMLSMTVYIAVLALALGSRFRGGQWRAIDLVGPHP
jgi:MATE family multidrug resistance protein